jgi:serine/threonine protein kinase/WD40 repeat protein
MSEPEAEHEERYTTWLAACDDALAAGAPPPDTSAYDSERVFDDLACVQLLREVLGGKRPADPVAGADTAAGALPWKRLGRFHLLRELGRGGCGVVFLAVDMQLGRQVALKVPHAEAALSPQLRERFQREARAASSLDHPNIVPVHEVGEVGPVSYIVSAYCPGTTLAEWLKANRQPVPFRDAASLVVTLADAVAHAHSRGVVHRDLKPSNVLLSFCSEPTVSAENAIAADSRLNDGTPKITDFGLAKLLESSGDAPTQTGVILGTVNYMAPEQAEAKTHMIGPAADIYALGAILYELLTGQPPFRGENALDTVRQLRSDEPLPPSRLRPRVPRDLQTICLKCLHKEPQRRYATAAALADDLRCFLDSRPILARRPSRAEIAWRWCRRNPAVSMLAASILGLLIAASIVSFVAADRFYVQRNQIADAEREKTKELVRSLIAQVRAGRRSGLPGRRLDSLDTLAKAVQLRAELGEPDDVPSVKEMRDEMIGCLILADMRPAHRWPGYPAGSWRLAFDGDLQTYVVADSKGTVRVARVEGDQELASFADPGDYPRLLRLSPDGRYVALMRWRDSRVRVWDVEHGEKLNLNIDRVEDNSRLAFDPQSRRLAVGHPDGTISLHELQEQRSSRRSSKIGQPGVGWLDFDPSGRRLALTRVGQKDVEILDVESNKIEQRLQHSGNPGNLSWSADGKRFAVNYAPAGIAVWNTATWRMESLLPGHLEAGGVFVAFAPDSDLLASRGWDNYIRLWHVPSAREVFRMTSGDSGEAFTFNRDSQRLACNIDRSEVVLWEVATSKVYRSLRRAERWNDLNSDCDGALSPDGRLLALASMYGVHFWDLTSGQNVALLPNQHAMSVAFAPQGDAIYVYGRLGLHRWPIVATPGSLGCICLGPPEQIPLEYGESLAMSADGRLLAVAIRNQGGKVLRLDQPRASTPLLPHPGAMKIALSPNGRWAAIGTQHDKGVKIFDTADNREVRHLWPENTRVSLGFSPDSRWLVAGGNGEYRFWRTGAWEQGIRVHRDCGEDGPIAFSPDSRTVALETARARISLIDPETGEEFARLDDPNGDGADWMAFTPDGCSLVSATRKNGAIHVWELHALRAKLAEAGLEMGLPPWAVPSTTRSQVVSWQFSFKLNADGHFWRACVAHALGDYAQAEADYREVLREQPRHGQACNDLAWLYSMAPPPYRKPREAMSLALTAVQQEPDHDRLNTLGVAYYRLERWQEAIDTFNKAFKVGLDHSKLWDLFFLAMCHHRLGHCAEASRLYKEGIALRAACSDFTPGEQAELDEIQAEAKVILSQ